MNQHTRSQILAAARRKNPDIQFGENAMIAPTEWGYWVASTYVSHKELDQYESVRHAAGLDPSSGWVALRDEPKEPPREW